VRQIRHDGEQHGHTVLGESVGQVAPATAAGVSITNCDVKADLRKNIPGRRLTRINADNFIVFHPR
jgi:hypothetical protein